METKANAAQKTALKDRDNFNRLSNFFMEKPYRKVVKQEPFIVEARFIPGTGIEHISSSPSVHYQRSVDASKMSKSSSFLKGLVRASFRTQDRLRCDARTMV
jgi:hypothetical protein